jgi:hypothetical protein
MGFRIATIALAVGGLAVAACGGDAAIAEDNGERSRASSEEERVDRLAKKWYGEKTTIEEVRKWKGLRITAVPYNIPGNAEMRWLLLFADNKIGSYNGVVVPMAIGSSRNKWILMSGETRQRLLAISRPTGESGVSEEQKLNPLVIPYLLLTEGEKSEIWTKGGYTYVPVQEVREYLLKLVPGNEDSDWIPQAASVYVDQDGVIIHHKVTDVLTVSS